MEDRCSKEKKNIYKKNTTENQVGYENVVLFPCLSNVALSWWLNVASTAGVAFLAYYTSQCSLPLCIYISPSLHLPHKTNVAQTLPLFGCGFKAKCWRICSDRTRFRAQWRREGGSDGNVGEKRMYEGEDRWIKERKQEQWHQHHCISCWHNWLDHGQFYKLNSLLFRLLGWTKTAGCVYT